MFCKLCLFGCPGFSPSEPRTGLEEIHTSCSTRTIPNAKASRPKLPAVSRGFSEEIFVVVVQWGGDSDSGRSVMVGEAQLLEQRKFHHGLS